jgi:hypothetical protein
MCAKFVGHGLGLLLPKPPAIPCFLAFKNTISEVLLVKNYHTWKQKWRSKINSQVESHNMWRKIREFVAISEVLLVKNYHAWKQKWRSKINSQVESDNIWRKKREFVATTFYYLLISGICFLYESSRPINVNLADAAINFVSYCSTLSAGGYKIWWS